MTRQALKGHLAHQFRRTTFVSIAGLMISLGVVLARWWGLHWTWLLAVLLFLPVLRKKQLLAILVIALASFMIGLLRGQASINDEKQLQQYFGQKITIIGTVIEEEVYDSRGRTVFSIRTSQLQPDSASVNGNLLRIGTFGSPGVMRGDVVRVNGKLTPTLGLAAGSIGFGEVEILGRNTGWLYQLRNKFVAGLYNALPEPAASFGAGLVLGQKTGLDQTWNNILRAAGLTHVIAVSGYNLTILVRVCRRFLRRRSRYQILIFSGLLVLLFVSLTGMSPSILRATIVVYLSLLAWYFGARWKPLPLIFLSSGISALIDPTQLWRSVGWYLSFLAFFGVLVVAPAVMKLWRKDASKHLVQALLVECACAQLMTWPITAAVFGQISLVGLVANIVVAGFIPLAMLLCLVAGLAGWLLPTFAGWLAWPAKYVLTFILDIANMVARLPGAQFHIQPSTKLTISILTVLCLLGVVLWRIAVVKYGRIILLDVANENR